MRGLSKAQFPSVLFDCFSNPHLNDNWVFNWSITLPVATQDSRPKFIAFVSFTCISVNWIRICSTDYDISSVAPECCSVNRLVVMIRLDMKMKLPEKELREGR